MSHRVAASISPERLFTWPGIRKPVNFSGSARLSGNGRYLLVSSRLSVVDLQTAQTQTPDSLPSQPSLGVGRVIADDGTVVFSDSGNLDMLQGTAVTRLIRSAISNHQSVDVLFLPLKWFSLP
jgi:hypothetical protein